MKIFRKIQDCVFTIQVAYLRRRTLNRKFDELTDNGLLDRIEKGEAL